VIIIFLIYFSIKIIYIVFIFGPRQIRSHIEAGMPKSLSRNLICPKNVSRPSRNRSSDSLCKWQIIIVCQFGKPISWVPCLSIEFLLGFLYPRNISQLKWPFADWPKTEVMWKAGANLVYCYDYYGILPCQGFFFPKFILVNLHECHK